jgi:hypothetical protein
VAPCTGCPNRATSSNIPKDIVADGEDQDRCIFAENTAAADTEAPEQTNKTDLFAAPPGNRRIASLACPALPDAAVAGATTVLTGQHTGGILSSQRDPSAEQPFLDVLSVGIDIGACWLLLKMDYKKNNISTDREKGRGNKRARVTRGSRNPKHGKRKRYSC